MSLKVFISSKTKLKDDREATERALRDLALEAVRVEMDHGVASTRSEEWLAALEECDLVVMLLDELPANEDEKDYYRSVRDELNLAERRGKPVLLFRRARDGEVTGDFVQEASRRRFPHRYQTASELGDAIRKSLLTEVYRRYKLRSRAVRDREAFYVQATKLVECADRRIYLGAQTPVVFFGPRRTRHFEEEFYQALMSWIESLTTPKGKSRECVIFFSQEETERELGSVKTLYDPEVFRQNLQRLDQIQSQGGQLHLIPTPGPHTFAVFDDTFVMWLRAGAEWFGVQDESCHACERLAGQVRRWTEADLEAQARAGHAGETEAKRWLARFEDQQAKTALAGEKS